MLHSAILLNKVHGVAKQRLARESHCAAWIGASCGRRIESVHPSLFCRFRPKYVSYPEWKDNVKCNDSSFVLSRPHQDNLSTSCQLGTKASYVYRITTTRQFHLHAPSHEPAIVSASGATASAAAAPALEIQDQEPAHWLQQLRLQAALPRSFPAPLCISLGVFVAT
eukprot:6207704-Pleurochrysis_carterae.AAC.1